MKNPREASARMRPSLSSRYPRVLSIKRSLASPPVALSHLRMDAILDIPAPSSRA
jgi:hypothetical protein